MTSQHSEIPQDNLAPEEYTSLSQSFRTFVSMLLLSGILHLGAAIYLSIVPRGITGPSADIFDVALSEPTPVKPSMVTPPEIVESTDEPFLPETPIQEHVEENTSPVAKSSPPALPVLAPPSSLMFGISSGSFASFGDGITLREDIRVYFLDILERINASWQKEGAGVKLSSTAMLMLSIERSGELRTVQTLQSSGNPLHDRLLAKAVMNAAPFQPVPTSYSAPSFETPLRFTPPLSLMSFGSAPEIIPPH